MRRTAALPPIPAKVLILLALALAAVPALSATVPPLYDRPNHLARAWILLALPQDEDLAAIYTVTWAAVPNIAFDLVTGAVKAIGWMAPEPASIYRLGQIYLVFAMLGPAIGALLLSRTVHGRWSIWPLLGLLMVWNYPLVWGFQNYLFSVGLALTMTAAWICLRQRDRLPPAVLGLLFMPLATLLLLCHLLAFGIYGVLLASYEIGRLWNDRTLLRQQPLRRALAAVIGAIQALPAGWILVTAPVIGDTGPTIWGTWQTKILALFSPTLAQGSAFDMALLLLLLGLLIGGLASRRLTIAGPLRLPLIVLFLITVPMPSELLGVWGIDMRFPLVVLWLALAATMPARGPSRLGTVIAALIAVLLVARVASITMEWRAHDHHVDQLRAALATLPRGTDLLSARQAGTRDQVFEHLPALAVIEAAAFVPTLFTIPGVTLVQVRPPRASLNVRISGIPTDDTLRRMADLPPPRPAGVAGDTAALPRDSVDYAAGWPVTFDHLLIFGPDRGANPLPERLTPLAEGAIFTLYRIKPLND